MPAGSEDTGGYRLPLDRMKLKSRSALPEMKRSRGTPSQLIGSTQNHSIYLGSCSLHGKEIKMPLVSELSSKPSLVPVHQQAITSLPAYTLSKPCKDGLKWYMTRFQQKNRLYPRAKHELKAGLEELYCSWRKEEHGESNKQGWMNYLMTRLDYLAVHPSAVVPGNVHEYCNKLTALY